MIILSAAILVRITAHRLNDRMEFLDNGTLRVGIDLDLGGAITYLSQSHTDVNVVNSSDWGRQIQMSHYSGPVPFAPHGKQPQPTWSGLGWNPIQSGDAFGNRSKVLTFANDDHRLYVKSIPMQWPLNNEPGECTFECWLQLDGNAVQVRTRLSNHRTDHTEYEGRGQELPAVYTNAPYCHLVSYSGDRPFQNDSISVEPSVFPWTGWQATENWAALLDDHNFGLGIWHPNDFSFIGGFFGKPGVGGPKDGPTGYIAPVLSEIIDANIDYGYNYTLILGKLNDIRQYVYRHSRPVHPPIYRFSKDRQHWIFHHAHDTGWPIRGELNVHLDESDATLSGPDTFWYATQAKECWIDVAYAGSPVQLKVGWKTPQNPGFAPLNEISIPLSNDGNFHRYRVRLADATGYTGSISGIRLHLLGGGSPENELKLRSVQLK